MEGKEKGRKKGREESSFPAPEWLPPSLQGKERNPPQTQCFQGKRGRKKGKRRRKGCLGIRFLRGIHGKKDERKEGKRMERMLFFSLSGGAFLSPEKERNPVVSREGEGKEEREKR